MELKHLASRQSLFLSEMMTADFIEVTKMRVQLTSQSVL
jgi:hypothetical protein